MSTALHRAIYARLAGTEVLTGAALSAQTALAALLAMDPDTSRPAALFGNKNDAALVYPLITFRPSAGSIDGRFADGLAMDDGVYDLEIWDNARGEAMLSDIEEQVMLLLDMRRQVAPLLPIAVGHLYWSEVMVPMQVIYDNRINAWAGLTRYRFVEAKY